LAVVLEQLRRAVPEPPTMELGVMVHVRPLGVDVLESATVPANPLTRVTVIVKLADWPGNTFMLVGLALIWKSTTWTNTIDVV
jgi:hypothetical protein